MLFPPKQTERYRTITIQQAMVRLVEKNHNSYKLHSNSPLYITETRSQNFTAIHHPWRQLRCGICQNLSL